MLAAAGYTEEDVAEGRYNEAFYTMMKAMIAKARLRYDAAKAALTEEDWGALLAPEAMRRIYSETLDLLEDDQCHVYENRYSLPKLRKARLVFGAWAHGIASRFFR